MPTAVRSHAKINLGLYIGAPRPDGFHSLATLYQTLEAHDIVTVSARPASQTSIRLTSNDFRVPPDSRNTAWKMVDLALKSLEISAEVEIYIEKRLPVQGGLGAGSANAVAALIGLEYELNSNAVILSEAAQLHRAAESKDPHSAGSDLPQSSCAPSIGRFLPDGWDDPRSPSHRLALAAQVGSDVPLFLIGGTVLGVDRGQEVYPLPDFEPLWCVLAIPNIGVSTPQAFRDWDALCAQTGLTAEASADKLEQLSRAYVSAFAGALPKGQQDGSSGVPSQVNQSGDLAGPRESALVRTGILSWIQNDFEQVVFPQHPSLREIKHILSAQGSPEAALHASLSGSGSALFGLYQARSQAEAASERLRTAGVKSILTRTLPRSEYWGGMLLTSED